MKIAVLTKAIPSYESLIRIDTSSKWIDDSLVNYVINESDAYALEEALKIKESLADNSEVVVVSMGSEDKCSKIIKDGLAKGADRAILIDSQEKISDPLSIATLISDCIKDEQFDLVFSGLQSDDLGSGQVGVLLGEKLKMSTATLAIETQIQPSAIRVKRELESGWFQWLALPLPASISIQSGINNPRYPSLKGIMGARNKEVAKHNSNQFSNNQLQSMVELYIPSNEKQAEKIEGDSKSVASRILEILKNDLRVIQ